MILFHNLEFFNKSGNNLNLEKAFNVTVTVEDIVKPEHVIKDNSGYNPYPTLGDLEMITGNLGDVYTTNDGVIFVWKDGRWQSSEFGANYGEGAEVEVVINLENQIETFAILKQGKNYTPRTLITIKDVKIGTDFEIFGENFVIRDSDGKIESIFSPTRATGFTFPAMYYKGEIFFKKLSTGLIETEHIYVTERVKSSVDGSLMLVYPRYGIFENGSKIDNIVINLEDGDQEIFPFTIDKSGEYPQIKKEFDDEFYYSEPLAEGWTNGDWIWDREPDPLVEGDWGEGHYEQINDVFDYSLTRILPPMNNTVMQLNIGASSNEEGIFENTLKLQIHDKDENGKPFLYTFAEILMRAEIEGEDERFRLALETFGFSLSQQDAIMLREADIKEHLPDFLMINEKRKEMLLEYSNIFPYIGSYKALVNILKYFDYNDLRIKEYWLNVEMVNRDDKRKSFRKGEKLKSRISEPVPSRIEEIETEEKIENLVKIHKAPLISKESEKKGKRSKFNNNQDFEKDEEQVVEEEKRRKHFPKAIEIGDMIKFWDKYNYIPNTYGKNNRKLLKFNEKYYKQVDIPFELKGKGRNWKDEDFLPSEIWKKTSLFSLHYDINKPSGKTDQWGIPEVIDNFMFSEEEALIKLFMLKRYLKEKFLPLHARIIDITGEGIYFARYAISTWKDDTDTLYVDKEFQPDFKVKSSYLIEDLQNYGEKVRETLPELANEPLLEYLQNALFKFTNTKSTPHNDIGPIGCILHLDCDTFDVSWKDMNLTWDDLMIFTSIQFDITMVKPKSILRFDDWFTGELSEFQFTKDIPKIIEPEHPEEMSETELFDWYNPQYKDMFVAVYEELLRASVVPDEDTLNSYYDPIISSFNYIDPIPRDIHGVEILGAFDYRTAKIIAYSNEINPRTVSVQFINGAQGIFKPCPNQGINTWETIGQHEFYELEWTVTHMDSSKFSMKIRDNIISGKNKTFTVPFSGRYRIDLTLWDLTNHSVRTHKYVDVRMPEIEVNMLTRITEHIPNWKEYKEIPWKSAGQELRTPALRNEVKWEDCQLRWEDFDLRTYNTTEDVRELFETSESAKMVRISEFDRFVGVIVDSGIDVNTKTVKCEGSFRHPELRPGLDFVFFRRDETIFKTKVIDVIYDGIYTTLILENLPIGLNKTWEVLREIGGNVLVDGKVDYDESVRINGLKVGQWLKFWYDEQKIEQQKILLEDIIVKTELASEPEGIILSMPIDKVKSEFGKVYRIKTGEIGTDLEILPDTMQIKINYDLEDEEIKPGFTEILLTSEFEGEEFLQRVLVQHSTHVNIEELGEDPINYTLLDVIEIDSDIRLALNGSSFEYAYWQFNVKLVHFNDSYGPTELLLNFNDYPYHSKFIKMVPLITEEPITPGLEPIVIGVDSGKAIKTIEDFNDINKYLDETEYKIVLNEDSGLWYFDYITKDGTYSIQVTNIGDEDGSSLITVNDDHSELFQIGPQFKLSWTNFDEDYAENRIGIHNHTWENYDEVQWKDLSALQWQHGEFYPGVLCSFEITKVIRKGTIRFENFPKFTFNEILDGNVVGTYAMWKSATNELNNSTNEGISKFSYSLLEIEEGISYKIIATSKNQTISSLGNLKFSNGVEGIFETHENGFVFANSYPLGYYKEWYDPHVFGPENKIAQWKPIARTYYEHELDKQETIKDSDLLNQVIGGSFTWDDFFSSTNSEVFRPMTTVFFNLSNIKIFGKKNFKWILRNRTNDEILCETIDKNFIWMFTEKGIYDLTIEVEDINGNYQTITKNGLITIQ